MTCMIDEKCLMADCGLSETAAKQFIQAMAVNDYKQQLMLLTNQRNISLERMHKAAKEIDCLDYLIFEYKRALERE